MNGIGNGLDYVFTMFWILLFVFLPLGMWKAIELIILFCNHISWN
jgi:hypothetical protein